MTEAPTPKAPTLQAPTPMNWASIGALGLIWGGTFLVVAIALEGYGPVTVATARTTLGALAMGALVLALRRPWPAPAPGLWSHVIGAGLLSTALPFFLLSWGIQHVPSAFAGLSMAAIPLFVLPLAALFSDEPFRLRRAAGVTVGFAGALVLIGPGLMRLGQGAVPLAQLACLGAALSYAVSSILMRRCPPIDPIMLSALTLLTGSVALVPAMLLAEGLPGWAGARPGAALMFLGLLPTALATLIRTQVIRSAGSVFMTLTNYMVPLWAMLLGAAVLGEELPWRFFAALALILSGLAISQSDSLIALLRARRPR